MSVLSDDAPVGASPGGTAKEATRRRRRVTTTVQSNDGVVRPAACPPPDCCLQPSAQRPCAHDTVCHSVRPTGGDSRTPSKRQLDCVHAPSSAWRLHEFKFLHKQHEEVAQASLRGKQMPAKMTYSGVALNERGPSFRIRRQQRERIPALNHHGKRQHADHGATRKCSRMEGVWSWFRARPFSTS